MVLWFDCPGCGLPESAPENGCCGKCEEKRIRERNDERQAEIGECERILRRHTDCDCYECTMAYVRLLTLKGRVREAEQLLNA